MYCTQLTNMYANPPCANSLIKAKTLVAPLDRVKILFQCSNPQFSRHADSRFGVAAVMKDIYRREGGLGLYRGHCATLLRIFPYASIQFLTYEQIRAIVIPQKKYETPLRRLVSGSLAGVTSVFFTYPLEVIRVRLAFETKLMGRTSISSICRQIYHETSVQTRKSPTNTSLHGTTAANGSALMGVVDPRTGLINFYRGFCPTVLGILPYAGISFLTHDTIGDLMRHPSLAQYTTLPQKRNDQAGGRAPLQSWAGLCAGGMAGLISQTASYPLEVIRRRMQIGGAVGDGRRLRLAETARSIFQERGMKGFYVGLTIGYIKVIPMMAVSFYTYGRIKLMLGI